MEFKKIIAIKGFIDSWNKVHSNYQLELWFPHMVRDGYWTCTIVAGQTMDRDIIREIIPFLYANQCDFFIGVLCDDLAISCQ